MQAIQRRTVHLLLAVCVGHVLLISVQVQSKSGLPALEAVAFDAFSRVQEATTATGDAVGGVWHHYVALGGVARNNEDLQREIVALESQLQTERALAAETHALEDALALSRRLPERTLAARVVAGDPSPGSLTVSIDRGVADGVKVDMAVLSVDGIVGRIVGRPAPHGAVVQLLTGRTGTAAAGAYLARSGSGGVVVGGSFDTPLRMLYLTNATDVRVGDEVLTSGEDGIFPRGYPIGTVARADRGNGLYRTTAVKPAADFSHLDVVLIVLDRPVAPAAAPAAPASPTRSAPAGGRGGTP